MRALPDSRSTRCEIAFAVSKPTVEVNSSSAGLRLTSVGEHLALLNENSLRARSRRAVAARHHEWLMQHSPYTPFAIAQTASGKTIVVNLVAPTGVSASYKIQRVTISQFSATPGLFPRYTAEASSDIASRRPTMAVLTNCSRAGSGFHSLIWRSARPQSEPPATPAAWVYEVGHSVALHTRECDPRA